MSELWTKSISADNGTATPDQLQAAWAAWIKTARTAFDLVCALHSAGLPRLGKTTTWSPAYRIADRMLQRARKAGVIRFNGKHWDLIP